MEDILRATSISDAFKNYILNEIRPDIPEPLYQYNYVIDIDTLAEELFRSQIKDNEDEETTETLEEIKAKLISKYTFKVKTIKPASISGYEPINNDNTYVTPEYVPVKVDINFAEVDDWEDAADQELVNSKKLIAEAESSFM
jgi:hypothetical protein